MRKKSLIKIFIFLCLSFNGFAQEGENIDEIKKEDIVTKPTEAVKEDALVLYRQGNYKRSVFICKRELDEPNRNLAQKMDSYAVMCWSLIKLEDYQQVVEVASTAIKLNSKDQRLFEILAEGYYYQNNYKLAIENFEKYIRLAPNGDRIGTVYFYIGDIYLKQKFYNLADVALTTAVHHSSKNSSWWASLGLARENSGKKAEAIDAYKNALKLNPNDSRASDGIARLSS